jgi:starch phosphorylase
MEIGIDSKIPTYSGGLGVLAADTIRACADLNVPLVAVKLLYKKGYFRQKIDPQGNQQELPDDWNPNDFLKLLPNKVSVKIEGRDVFIQAWEYGVKGVSGYYVPIIFLDVDLRENNPSDRTLTYYLYGQD